MSFVLVWCGVEVLANPVVVSELMMLVRNKNDFAERKTTIIVLCHDSIENIAQVAFDLDQVRHKFI